MSNHHELTAIGFFHDEQKGLCFPDGTPVRAKAMARLDQLGGRLNNIRYMASVMDEIDGALNPASSVPGGRRQFEHLVKNLPAAALIYFAPRRLQRAGDIAALRQGLTILLAFDHDEICAADAVAALWPAGAEKPYGLPALPRPALALEAA